DRPDFIRSLAGIRVFSSSSDCRLVPLSGEVLLSFLSKLDCSVRGCAESAFNLKWDSIADSVFAGLEDRSLSDVSCKDFINIFNTVSAPVVVFSTYQEYEKKRVMDRRKNSAVAIGEVVAAERGGGRFSAQKSAVALDCASLCAMVLPECALMIKGLFSKVGALASSIYEDMVSKQLPQEISDKLSVTERAIWHRTYMEMCEVGFVSRCLGEYHTEHRPNFVRSISKIQVLSDAKGDLLDFLLGLDCAIRREIESVFSSCWSKVSVSLEDESLSAISCRDFVRVLDVAGILAMALSVRIGGYIRKKGSKGEGVAPVTSVVDLTHSSLPNPQSLPSQASTSTASEVASEVSISSASASLSVQYVDLLGVRLHPDSAKLIYDLFSDIRKSAKMSCSMALGSLLRSVSNGLSMVGQAVIWCRTYKELHLLGFMARFLCLYHSRYRPDFIRSLAGIRVFSSSSDCRLVPLSGEGLLSFLSKLDCSVRG
ncbi:hypothetical protein, partial [Candidatus Ichthyocystis sparus]|uniref:hypothetical protein n=1 Tax=Candidatus Ichthyocystis sparus TaxID=1561004 RepID=UPI000AFFA630